MSVRRKNEARLLSQEERVAISDGRMFNAAIRLISERGTHNTTLKDVGEEAGYSRGLASYRFGSKEELFSSLVSHFNTRWKDELDHHVGDKTGLGALLASLNAVEDFLTNEPTYMKAMYILWYESISSYEKVRERLAKLHSAYRHDAARWLEEGKRAGEVRVEMDSEGFAVLYWSFLSGTIYQWLAKPDSINIAATFRLYKQLSCDTLQPTPS